ncbi:unnamed protein product [Leptidea sinapis]|uniref:RING-type domain-containing protein n=1 Tax=Leptidea sinapis TaxID=189913 RepID=A0A5E4QHE4_9NEOP|nr:unnamed protein product [Leptidea sinapis]
MAEALDNDNDTVMCDSESTMIASHVEDDEGPSRKKRKTGTNEEPSERLEQRLGGILCCAVCLDLPPAAVYQCSNGHLMCAPCFTHLLADARLRDESATCPNCRIEISRTSASRNLAVEKTVSELPIECRHCTHVFPRHSIEHHEEKTCEERCKCGVPREYKFTQLRVDMEQRKAMSGLVRIAVTVYSFMLSLFRRTYLVPDLVGTSKRRRYHRVTGCKFASIGCLWRGAARVAGAHEATCERPALSAGEVLDALAVRERCAADQLRVYTQIFDMLSYEKITFNDLQLKPYRTDEFVHKLYYETLRFPSFGHHWC